MSLAGELAEDQAKDAGMGQLPLEAAKMSLAAIGVGKGLGDSPLTQPGTNTLLPLTQYPGLPHSKPAKAQNNPEDQTAGWQELCSAFCSSCSSSVWTEVRGVVRHIEIRT